MSEPPNASAAPNWYPDPSAMKQLRYWDGVRWTDNTAPWPSAIKRMSGGAWAAIIGGVVAVIIGLAVAFNVFISRPFQVAQHSVISDNRAKADASKLGSEIAAWYADRDHVGPPPSVVVRDGEYFVDGERVGRVSPDVELQGVVGTGPNDWCVWVKNPDGDHGVYAYSADRTAHWGTCE